MTNFHETPAAIFIFILFIFAVWPKNSKAKQNLSEKQCPIHEPCPECKKCPPERVCPIHEPCPECDKCPPEKVCPIHEPCPECEKCPPQKECEPCPVCPTVDCSSYKPKSHMYYYGTSKSYLIFFAIIQDCNKIVLCLGNRGDGDNIYIYHLRNGKTIEYKTEPSRRPPFIIDYKDGDKFILHRRSNSVAYAFVDGQKCNQALTDNDKFLLYTIRNNKFVQEMFVHSIYYK